MHNGLTISIIIATLNLAQAQQWTGSTTTSDAISRFGQVNILPTANSLPYTQIKNTGIRISTLYGSPYPGSFVNI